MAEIIRAHHWWWPILAEEGRADFREQRREFSLSSSSFYGVKVVLGRELNCIDFELENDFFLALNSAMLF
ncbi:unnamed protein product [Prunus armeniaca]|uniref:Uncharacterized protein n=1 Tax=Prunus armeniaca TaxID=36596 RepID=A0A6J5W464_PRUAR|nr:unnamed protein product [Prunus armeniaca]